MAINEITLDIFHNKKRTESWAASNKKIITENRHEVRPDDSPSIWALDKKRYKQ